MTSLLPDLNIANTPIYEGLVAVRGDPYQVDRPEAGWSLSTVGTDYGAANDILGRLLAQGCSDGQGWVAVLLVGGPAAAQLTQQLAQGTQALQAVQALQNQGRPWSQVADDPISASMASHMAAGIVRNALEASSPGGFMYDQYADQPDPYAASALTPAPDPSAQYAAMQAQAQAQAQFETSGQYPATPMTGQPGMGVAPGAIPPGTPTSALPPGVEMTQWINPANAAAPQEVQLPQFSGDVADPRVPTTRGAYPAYPDAAEDSPDGRFGRFGAAMRAFRGR